MRGIVVVVAGALLAFSSSAAAQGGRGAGTTAIQPGEDCPPGMTEIRPQTCRAPEFSPPSIVDYRPRSTLVTDETLVPRPRYPVVDFHGHPRGFGSPEGLAELGAAMDEIGIGLMVAANSMSGERLRDAMAVIEASPAMRDRVRIMTGIDFGGVGSPDWAARAVRRLEADAAAGAVGIGEVGKGLGLSHRKADGSRLRIDDPDLDPVWEAAARLGLPVFIHTGDPAEFFEPLDYENERWLELALFPGRRFPPEEYPSFEQLVEERDNLFRRHPNTTFVTAHLGWQASDLGTLGRLLDELPNVYTEIGAVLYDIGRQPRTARDFFVRHQDRILFGKDSFQPGEYPYYWRVLETADEYFDYYRNYHAFWKLYGIDLPDDVLRKVYFENALRILPGAPREGWPR
jgi:predicted TIM-barrel fold metal-dependent hydrolase